MQKEFEVFISYRRSYYEVREDGTKRKIDVGFSVAREVAFLLSSEKYGVYFDDVALPGGDDYERHIFKSIPQCNDVILVLVPHAFDRCTGENDVFGREIVSALENKKNIIPVFVNGFTMPETLDELPEMLSVPAKKYLEETGRSFVRLQGARVEASETVSTENVRMIKNTIFTEVLPYLKSRPGITRKTPPPEPVKKSFKLAVSLAVVIIGVFACVELLKTPPPDATAQTAENSAPVVPEDVGDAAETEPPAAAESVPAESEETAVATTVENPEAKSTGEPAPEIVAQNVPVEAKEPESASAVSESLPEAVPAPAPVAEELFAAVKGGNAERVSEILAAGTDANAVSAENGATALCSAAVRGNLEIVSLLIDAGADPNFAIAESGLTPLHLAAAQGNVPVVKLLLGSDASAAAKDKNGLTPADFASDAEVKSLLENFSK